MNVWAGLLNDTLIGPYFMKYETMLRGQIIPRIKKVINNHIDEKYGINTMELDHISVRVRAYLDTEFPDRWIGRRA